VDSDRVVKISFLQPVGPKMILPEFGRSDFQFCDVHTEMDSASYLHRRYQSRCINIFPEIELIISFIKVNPLSTTTAELGAIQLLLQSRYLRQEP